MLGCVNTSDAVTMDFIVSTKYVRPILSLKGLTFL